MMFVADLGLAADNNLYRYKNSQGTVVIDDHVPPAFTKKGYEVLNSQGHVLEVVPRQLTEDEILNLSSEEARQRNAKQEQETQLAYDRSLLMRYSDHRDIEAVRDRNIKELEIRLSILRGNVINTKAQVERQQEKAANVERKGKNVPENLLNNINGLKKEIELAELDISARKIEIEAVRQQYQKDIDRLRYLIEVMGYRRR